MLRSSERYAVLFGLAVSLMLAAFQQTVCQPGQVLEVARGRDYTLNICGVGVIALRGVEPPFVWRMVSSLSALHHQGRSPTSHLR